MMASFFSRCLWSGSFLFLLALTVSAQNDVTPAKAKASFESADRRLNSVWAKLKLKLSPAEFAELQREQRSWVEYRDYTALSPGFSGAPEDEKEALKSAEYFTAAADLTESRRRWLISLLQGENAAGEEPEHRLNGTWTDSFGGSLEIVAEPGKIYFVLQVVRGPTAHVGALSGVASWNRTIGWFSDKGREADKEDETNLSFVLKGPRLELTGANTSSYHGVRAYFDGTYVRTGRMDAAGQQKVKQAALAGDLPEE